MMLFPIVTPLLAKCRRAIRCSLFAWFLSAAAVYGATPVQRPGMAAPTSPAGPPLAKKQQSGARSQRRAEAVKTPEEVAPSAPVEPAKILLQDGTLTIHANNSDLSGILHEVASVSGMSVQGSVASAPVYGMYGPGNPREVLSSLLDGAGYNIIMTGLAQQGAPGELKITARSGGAAPAGRPPQAGGGSADSENTTQGTPEQSIPEEEAGPGAIVHAPPPPSDDPQERVQQNLRKLQQMQDAQQGQQSSPQ